MATKKEKPVEETALSTEVLSPEELEEFYREQEKAPGQDTFPILKIPSGGGQVFDLPNADPTKEIVAVMLYQTPRKSYWKDELNGEGKMPDCQSFDGINGRATEPDKIPCPSKSGLCAECPMNKLGTAIKNGKKTRAKACNDKRFVYFITDLNTDQPPYLLRAPYKSINAINEFNDALKAEGKEPYIAFWAHMSLGVATNKEGKPYSFLQLKRGKKLAKDELVRALTLRKQYLDAMKEAANFIEIEDEEADSAAPGY